MYLSKRKRLHPTGKPVGFRLCNAKVYFITQGGYPNPDIWRNAVPEKTRRKIAAITNNLIRNNVRDHLSTGTYLPNCHKLESDVDFETLYFFEKLIKNKYIGDYYLKHPFHSEKLWSGKSPDLYFKPLQYSNNNGSGILIDVFMLVRKKFDYRPMLFFVIATIDEFMDSVDVTTDVPVFFCFGINLYKKYEKFIYPILQKRQIGIIVLKNNDLNVISMYETRYLRYCEITSKYLMRFCKDTSDDKYRAEITPYGYYQIR